ncbi:uncharacterized protein EI97DRAFT_456734 [Westerdykella ornata]|uniref:HIT-type domain-containing protein n=1 Tax=Westerdykella ornata TaxID=318751 RepID=A0A6A6JPY4_WESOR|nr:uncharacterized protein EI97DRAFT_456734 [Westerdykella ornata]KAF2278315.1 hypothetical protein EI97DRAFT_456734 [Westerdykella ornata]
MPLVEVIPNNATSTVAPRWTYVVDTGYDPSKVAFNPKDRKRVPARPGGPRGDTELSARQQTAIARRIAELSRDNDPKQVIAIPWKGAAAKTQNTRRILQYQRQIKHWLDDEEALLQQAPPPRAPAATGRAAALRRRSTLASIPPTPAEATTAEATPAPTAYAPQPNPELDSILSVEKSRPAPLNPAELEALLSAPPLLYGESHATLGAGGPPQRRFCDNCGYWGKIKCLKCGARICGLECKDAHEATRCLKWA